MKTKLDISMDSDATDDQVETVQKAFGEYFDIDVKRNILRRSASGDAPLLIAFTLNMISAVTWDSIKLAAQAFFTQLPTREASRAAIDIHQRGQRNVTIMNSKVIIFNFKSDQEFPEDGEYDSIDQALALIKKLDEKFIDE
jgi:hypothetical protein